jgi:hypothetical protein
MFLARFIFAVAALMLLAAPAEAADGMISGRISLGGRPLAAGKITFHKADGQFFGCKVKEGGYAITHIAPGLFTVTVDGAGVHAKYSSEETSALKVALKEGANVVNFDLAD